MNQQTGNSSDFLQKHLLWFCSPKNCNFFILCFVLLPEYFSFHWHLHSVLLFPVPMRVLKPHVSAKYLKPTTDLSISCLGPYFCSCRALTSLRKTRRSSCLFAHEDEKAELHQRATIVTSDQTRCFAPSGSCFGSARIPRTCKANPKQFCFFFSLQDLWLKWYWSSDANVQ